VRLSALERMRSGHDR